MLTESLTNKEWLPGELLSGLERWRPGWFLDMKCQTCLLWIMHKLAWKHTTWWWVHYSACPIRAIFFSKIVDHTENERLFHRVEVARYSKFHFGAGLSKQEGFSWIKKKRSDRAWVHPFQSVCAKTKSSRTIAVEYCSAQKVHSSDIALLQILTYFLLVTELLPFLWRHIHILFTENFYSSIIPSPP